MPAVLARWAADHGFEVAELVWGNELGGLTGRLVRDAETVFAKPSPVDLRPEADRLDWLQQKVSTVARNCGIEVERRKFRPHVTLARFSSSADTGHHIAQFMASYSRFRAGPWVAEHFSLFSSRQGRNGSIYTEEAAYHLAF